MLNGILYALVSDSSMHRSSVERLELKVEKVRVGGQRQCSMCPLPPHLPEGAGRLLFKSLLYIGHIFSN